LKFINSWNSYLWPLIVTNTVEMRTCSIFKWSRNYIQYFNGIFIDAYNANFNYVFFYTKVCNIRD
jgi:ABC-type glycerol-3-phosphate transport system permease component